MISLGVLGAIWMILSSLESFLAPFNDFGLFWMLYDLPA
jgi:hypothetical protein